MKTGEIVERLNNTSFDQINEKIETMVKDGDLEKHVVIIGESDDLVEAYGALGRHEIGAYGGTDCVFFNAIWKDYGGWKIVGRVPGSKSFIITDKDYPENVEIGCVIPLNIGG